LLEASILMGLIVLIGLALQRKPISEIFVGTIRAMAGIVLLNGGIIVLGNCLGPLNSMLVDGFGIKGYYPEELANTGAAYPWVGAQINFIFALGYLLHFILAAIFPWESLKQVYLTPHFAWTAAGAIAITFYNFGLFQTGILDPTCLAVAVVIQAFYLSIACAIVWPIIKKITKGQFGFGHGQSTLLVTSALFAKILGNPKKSTEEVKFPEGFQWLKETLIVSVVIFTPLFLIPCLLLGPEVVESTWSGGTNFVIWSIKMALTGAAGIEIILIGIRMFIGEILPAFTGISQKLLRGTIPALDCPAIYPFAPVAQMIGIAVYTVVNVAVLAVQAIFGIGPLILPNIFGFIFVGSSAGVVGNAVGGLRGAIICAAVYAVLYPLVAAIAIPFLGMEKMGMLATMSVDEGILSIIIGGVLKLLGF